MSRWRPGESFPRPGEPVGLGGLDVGRSGVEPDGGEAGRGTGVQVGRSGVGVVVDGVHAGVEDGVHDGRDVLGVHGGRHPVGPGVGVGFGTWRDSACGSDGRSDGTTAVAGRSGVF